MKIHGTEIGCVSSILPLGAPRLFPVEESRVDLNLFPMMIVIPMWLLIMVGALLIVMLIILAAVHRRGSKFGYKSLLAYLRAVPRNDPEKRDAVDLALQGAVLCLLGIAFLPLMLIGLMPLYYGARKLILICLGVAPHSPPVERSAQRSQEV